MHQPEPIPTAARALASGEVARLRDLSAGQWRSGAAAWLGWMFDGLDMHLYTLVALPFVAELLHTSATDPLVGRYSSWIQAAFLIGWAIGGGFFGRIGDRLGRSQAPVAPAGGARHTARAHRLCRRLAAPEAWPREWVTISPHEPERQWATGHLHLREL